MISPAPASRHAAVEAGRGVLIVDDQAPFRSVARSLVERLAGWHVVAEAASGEEAVALAFAKTPGLVLMDINLPGINGIEATRRIMGLRPGTIVVLLSTYGSDDVPADAMSCGARAYIRKDDLTPRLLRGVLED